MKKPVSSRLIEAEQNNNDWVKFYEMIISANQMKRESMEVA
jgi:hypothetical protein